MWYMFFSLVTNLWRIWFASIEWMSSYLKHTYKVLWFCKINYRYSILIGKESECLIFPLTLITQNIPLKPVQGLIIKGIYDKRLIANKLLASKTFSIQDLLLRRHLANRTFCQEDLCANKNFGQTNKYIFSQREGLKKKKTWFVKSSAFLV